MTERPPASISNTILIGIGFCIAIFIAAVMAHLMRVLS